MFNKLKNTPVIVVLIVGGNICLLIYSTIKLISTL